MFLICSKFLGYSRPGYTENVVPLFRDGMFCLDLASTVISLCFSHLCYMIKCLPGKAGFRLHVNWISARRDDFSPYKHNSCLIQAISKNVLSMADNTAATGEGAKTKQFRWSSAMVQNLLNRK